MFPMVISEFISVEESEKLIKFLDPRAKPSPRDGIDIALGFRTSLDASVAGISGPIIENFNPSDEEKAEAYELLTKVFVDVKNKFSEVFGAEAALTQCVYQVMNKGARNPLHSDTTNLDGSPLQPDGTPEELEWSGLLYLNNHGPEFEGGTIYFPKQDVEIIPKAGDLVLFPGDVAHVHEVPEIVWGQRKNLVFFYGREGVVGSDRNFFDLDNFSPENYEKYGKDARINQV
jgi:hypothetical protein